MASLDAKEYFELFPEDLEELNEKQATAVLERIGPKLDEILEQIGSSVNSEIQEMYTLIEAHTDSHAEYDEKISSIEKQLLQLSKLNNSLNGLAKTLDASKQETKDRIGNLSKSIQESRGAALGLINELNNLLKKAQNRTELAHTRLDNLEPFDDKDIWEELTDLRKLILSRPIGGGGNMNRNISIGGNTSVLSRYTDVNIKAGNNVTLTYANNDTTKYLDLTITASGGGGGGGLSRSINSISTSQTAGGVAATDYVYICSAGLNLTLPAPALNTNLYTIKNTSTSSVLVSPNAAETIDGSSTLILATQYTSVDLESDGTNWVIT